MQANLTASTTGRVYGSLGYWTALSLLVQGNSRPEAALSYGTEGREFESLRARLGKPRLGGVPALPVFPWPSGCATQLLPNIASARAAPVEPSQRGRVASPERSTSPVCGTRGVRGGTISELGSGTANGHPSCGRAPPPHLVVRRSLRR